MKLRGDCPVSSLALRTYGGISLFVHIVASLQQVERESPRGLMRGMKRRSLCGEARGVRGAAMRCLTEAARLAMIGIDVLYVETGEAHEQQEAATTECAPKQKTTTFLLELPLAVDRGQAARLRAHLDSGQHL